MSCAFQGYFIKKGNTELDNTIIAEYSNTPNIRTDKNSYTDNNGTLHRNILPIKRSKISFTTVESLAYDQKIAIQSIFPNRDTTELVYWNDELNCYKKATFYVPEIEFVIDRYQDNELLYKGFTVSLIAYGGDSNP